MVDKAQAEISGLQSVFPGNKIFLCRFHVAKAFIYQIKKGRLTADDQELLFKATQKLMYSNQATCAEALLNIEKNFPTFYVYLQENWLTIPEMFMGHYRKGLMHLDNHTNNRLKRYHRTLKDVGLLSRVSPGNLIDKILKVNRVQIEKSKHADFDQQLKINNKLPEPLKFYSRHVSSFILRHLMEQYDKSIKSDFSLYEDRDSLQIIDRQSTFYNIIDWVCICDAASGFGVPCAHVLFALRTKNVTVNDLQLIHKRWISCNTVANQVSFDQAQSHITSNIELLPLCCATPKQRFTTAMSYLQPIASLLAEMPPKKFELAITWLESINQQCISGEWELMFQSDPCLEVFTPAEDHSDPCLGGFTSTVDQSDPCLEGFTSTEDLSSKEILEVKSPSSADPMITPLECINKEICEVVSQEPHINLVLRQPQRKPPGRVGKNKQRLFDKAIKAFEKLGSFKKDHIRLCWFVERTVALQVLHESAKITTCQFLKQLSNKIADPRATLDDIKQYFVEDAWAEVIKRCEDVRIEK
nr:uncharacterized protein LOC105844616 [Hydra vulgaris]XP_047143445.1 uncharacterized protein LOC105844616 [Hydra vulgaris]XP_047143446.1 uncharacterized protein LOC105844616 [Hydra vulgaris]